MAPKKKKKKDYDLWEDDEEEKDFDNSWMGEDSESKGEYEF
jgi:hypothetical protein